PDFALTVAATPSATVVGQNVTWNGTLTALSGYSGTVSLSCVGPATGTCVVNPSQLAPTPSGAAFTVTVGNATTGTFNFSIQGTDGTLTHTQAVSLTVGTDVEWTDTGSASATVKAGQGAIYTFSAAPVGDQTFSGAVNFACANLPALTNCSFSPEIAAGARTTTVTLTIATTGPNQGTEFRKAVPSIRYPASSEKLGPPRAGKTSVGIGLAWLLTIPIAGMMLAGFARRKTSTKNAIAACALTLFWLALLVACGGLGGGSGGSGVTVAVNPSAVSLQLNASQQFSATVVNGSSQAVTWAVTGSPENGTITSSGLYTAPTQMPNPQTPVTVTATSPLASSPGTATVTLTGPQATVTVSPAEATVPLGGQQQFTATVSDGSSVTWTVNGAPANGTID